MNASEFSTWTDYHCTAFPSLSKWLAANAETMTHWERALADVRLDAARKATDAMLAGELDEPHGFGKHPATIRKYCRQVIGATEPDPVELRPIRYGGEETYRCADCQDSGTRLVVDPRSKTWAACCVACECDQGDRWRNGFRTSKTARFRRLPTFTARCMFPVALTLISESEKAACREWLADPQRRAEAMPNYEDF